MSKEKILKAALYIRVSTQYQIDKDSLPVQREELINYAKYALGIERYEVFEDAGYSGKNTERPAYKQMMARLRTGEFSHLCVWKIDRISRNLLDFAEMYKEIKKLGITFVSKNEQFDTSTAIGEAMLKIILVFAELERNMTSERVMAVMLSRANDGKWNGGRIPFGYDYDKEAHLFSINEHESSIILLIYDLYEANNSLLEIARILNEKGLKPRSGFNWSPTTVSKMLKNSFYTGSYTYNKHDVAANGGNSSEQLLKDESEWIVIENHHPAIVSKERQDTVAAMLRSRNYNPKMYIRKNVHIFSGILYCGFCGNRMQATIDRARKDGHRPSIYACSSKRRFRTCPNKYISDIVLIPFVFNYLSNIIKASNNFGKRTTLETFERKLLRGEWFDDVDHIDPIGLKEMYDMLKAGKFKETVFTSKRIKAIENDGTPDETELLIIERRKKERALDRLRQAYLFDETAIPETEYILQHKSLTDDIKSINQRLDEISENRAADFSISDQEFISKASYYILVMNLTNRRYVDYDILIKNIDRKIMQEFVQCVIAKIVISSGKIDMIRFKNGIEHRFSYINAEIENAENPN